MGERHREPRNGAKESLQRRFFRPVPGLVNWLREPTAYAVGYVVSPSGLGALLAAMPLCGAGNLARSRLSGGFFEPLTSVGAPKEPTESRLQPGLAAPQFLQTASIDKNERHWALACPANSVTLKDRRAQNGISRARSGFGLGEFSTTELSTHPTRKGGRLSRPPSNEIPSLADEAQNMYFSANSSTRGTLFLYNGKPVVVVLRLDKLKPHGAGELPQEPEAELDRFRLTSPLPDMPNCLSA